MKYVLTFVEAEQFAQDLANMSDTERDAAFDAVDRWFAEHAAKITHHVHLQPAHTATTVRLVEGRPQIIDGPFVEGKELVSGFVEVDVADLDEALAMARTWPGCPIVELRPAAV
jgi:hypothetical protein